MPRPRREWRDDQLFCNGHRDWHHHSRFNRRRRETPEGVIWEYDPDCRLWQQTERVARKHVDEARSLVERRAKKIVTHANRTTGEKIGIDFVMGALNYKCLIPMVRAYQTWPEECFCPNCGSPYDAPIELDHRSPPRHPRDWARLHARNIGPLDHECNTSKSNMPWDDWLDLEESKRLDAQAHNDRLHRYPHESETPKPPPKTDPDQGTLW